MAIRRRVTDQEAELNVTTFMNLMVVLIPFLLLNAVFVQMSTLTLQLPDEEQAAATSSETDNEDTPLHLVLSIHADGYELVEKKQEIKQRFPLTDSNQYDGEALNQTLLAIKQEHPTTERITLLSEPQISYELLIYTMDKVRAHIKSAEEVTELFPDISIGSVPTPKSEQEQNNG